MFRRLWELLLVLLAVQVWFGFIRCDDEVEEEVLLALKEGISDGSGSMSNWISGTGYCKWTGIQCDQEGRVESIVLRNRVLHGTITPLLGRLQYLRVLNMEINNLTGSIPATLENCTRLANISLGSNRLTGKIPENLDRLRDLQRLDLWDNQLEGTIPASIGNCSGIDYLSLGQNFLTGEIPSELGKLSKLLILRLFTNSFTGSFPYFLTNCTRLQVISFRNNSLTGFIPREVERWVDLQQLRIQSNFFEDALPPHIGNMTSLYYIDISSNRLVGSIPRTFGQLRSLQELYLNNNSLTGQIPEELTDCQNLGTIDLSHNQLDGPLPENLGDFRGLTNLTLDHNAISGRIPESVGRLKLINLDLSHNQLSGSLPASLAMLSDLQISLNLAYNSLSGSMPAWIGNLKVVQNILLQSNNFSGEIPTSLDKCVGLQSLDLSLNQLTGVIPSSLSSLEFLVFFNVSMNKLQGPVPTEGRFNKLSAAAFLGNPGLCGGVLNRSCPQVNEGGEDNSHKIKRIVIAASVGGICSCLVILVSAWFVFRCCYHPQGVEVDPLREEETDSEGSLAGPLIVFNDQELRRMTSNYEEEIGVGGFCRVYKGRLLKDDVAVKLLRIDMTKEVLKSFFAEVRTLGRVRHRNLVRLLGYCRSVEVKALVLEFMPNGSLQQHLKSLDWKTRFRIALGVGQGMAYLHHGYDSPIIHCDLKPANILLDLEFEPHVADFGISKIAHGDDRASVTTFRGSIGYTPPEYGSSASVTTKGDVYSYGIVLLELLTGRSPTSGMFGITSTLRDWVESAALSGSISQVIDPRMTELRKEESETTSNELEMRGVLDLALLCTSYSPSSRPSMQQALTKLLKLCDRQAFPPMEVLLESPSPYEHRLL